MYHVHHKYVLCLFVLYWYKTYLLSTYIHIQRIYIFSLFILCTSIVYVSTACFIMCMYKQWAVSLPNRGPGPPGLNFEWAGGKLKPFDQKRSVKGCSKIRSNGRHKSDSLPWKGMARFAFQCFWLLFSDWLLIFRIFLPIHSSFWFCNQSSQLIKNSTQCEHLNNSLGNVSILQLHCRTIIIMITIYESWPIFVCWLLFARSSAIDHKSWPIFVHCGLRKCYVCHFMYVYLH